MLRYTIYLKSTVSPPPAIWESTVKNIWEIPQPELELSSAENRKLIYKTDLKLVLKYSDYKKNVVGILIFYTEKRCYTNYFEKKQKFL